MKKLRDADDFVVGFAEEQDARRVMDVLPRRFGRYGLTVHPTKTRLVDFIRPRITGPEDCRPDTFDFLGFAHYWGRSYRGGWVIKRKTASSRLRRGIESIRTWCRDHRHQPLGEQHAQLSLKLRGHYAYYGVTNNQRSLRAYRDQVRRLWRKWLSRRNRRDRVTWEMFARLEQRFPLPHPRTVHSVYALATKS